MFGWRWLRLKAFPIRRRPRRRHRRRPPRRRPERDVRVMVDLETHARPTRRIWMWAAVGAVAIHALFGALAFAYRLPQDEDEALGAIAIEIGTEFAAVHNEPTDLPPGPDTEAATA